MTDTGGVGRQMPFALYGAANRIIRLHRPFLDPLGLTFPQYLVMVELMDRSPRTVGDLSHRLGMDSGTMTPLLKRLERAGLVSRERDPDDERRVLIELTAAGREMEEAVRGVNGQIEAACLTTCDMTADEIEVFRRNLIALGQPADHATPST